MVGTTATTPRSHVLQHFLKFAPLLTGLCILVGLGWLFVLPLDDFSRGNYISENALLPGQVEAYFGGSEVNILNAYRAEVQSWANSEDPNLYIEKFEAVLQGLQLKTAKNVYRLDKNRVGLTINGTNVYGILRAPRGDATEAIVISTSWKTLEGKVDLGGVSLLLSLAGYFRRWSLWSKDIIFLLVAEPLAGTSVWLEAYHSDSPRYTSTLPLKSGEIQAAIQIAYPEGGPFDAIEIMYDGVNGQLANLDLINSAAHIASAQVRVPVFVQDVRDDTGGYTSRLKTLLKGMIKQGLGVGSGSGTFGRYKIDAITLKASGAHGNHDDVSFGRVVESLCRSLNNLLEHLHQSFFFYFLLSASGKLLGEPGRFVSIGTYLPSAMIVAAGFTVTAIGLWMAGLTSPALDRKEKEEEKDAKPAVSKEVSIGYPLGVVAVLHGVGFTLLAGFEWIEQSEALSTVAITAFFHSIRVLEIVLPLALGRVERVRLSHSPQSSTLRPNSQLIQAFSLLALGMALSTLSTLNFSLGIFVGVLSSPLAFVKPLDDGSRPRSLKIICAIVLMQLISPLNWFYLIGRLEFAKSAIELARFYRFAWKVWGAWTPFVWWCIWWPAWVAGLVVLMAPV